MPGAAPDAQTQTDCLVNAKKDLVEMEPHYDTKHGLSETNIGRRIFNYNFRMQGHEMEGWQMLKAVPMHRTQASRR